MHRADLKVKLVFTVYYRAIGTDSHWTTDCAFENEEDAKQYIKDLKEIDAGGWSGLDLMYKYHQTPFYVRPPYGSTIGDQ